ncbi:MAG: hypothetical protein ABIR11_10195, partial [Candidatus Limnocylindrales bacterium]
YENQLHAQSQVLFGFGRPLGSAISGSFSGPGTQAVELAQGLRADLVTATANPELGLATVQRVRVSDGQVSDMMSGQVSCDPAQRTAWGTVVVGAESGATGRLRRCGRLHRLLPAGGHGPRPAGLRSRADPDVLEQHG